MKVNVHGLVFVGFAAAILAGAAHAAGENIVTSKAYTDATYQAKTAANNAGKVLKMNTDTAGDIGYTDVTSEYSASTFGGNTTGGNLVTESAVAAAIAAAGAGENDSFELTSHKLDGTTGNTIGATTSGQDGNDTTMYPSAAAVKEYVADQLSDGNTPGSGYQHTSTANYQLGGESGSWKTLEAGTYIATPTQGSSTSAAIIDIDQSKINNTGAALTSASNTDTDLVTDYTLTGAMATKQPKAPGTGANADKALVGFGDGTWTTLNGTDYVQVAKYNDGTKDVMRVAVDPSKIDNAGTGIYDLSSSNDSGADNLTTAWAVNQAISEAITDADLSGKQDNLGGTITVGGESVSTAGKVVVATATAGTVDYKGIDTQVTANSNNLITSDAVADALAGNGTAGSGYQHTSTANYQIGNSTGTWDTMGNGTYTTWARDANTGAVTVDVNAETAAAGVTNGATTIPTSGAVADAIAAATGNQTIPQKDTTVCTASLPCALVAEGNRLNWRVMAVSAGQTTPAGACGNANDNCGDA